MSSSPRRSQAWLEPSDPHLPEVPVNNGGREPGTSFHVDVNAPNDQDQFRHRSAAGLASRFDGLQHQHQNQNQAEQQLQHWGTATAMSSAYSNALCNQGFNVGMYPTMGFAYLLNNNPAPAPVVHANSVPYVMAAASRCATMPTSHQFVHYGYSPYSLYQMQPLSTLQLSTPSKLATQHLPDVTVAERESTPDDEDAFKLLFMEKFQQKLSTRFTPDEPAASQQNGGSDQQTSLIWGQVLDNYLEQKRTLVDNTRQLLDAQIAHQRSILQRQYDSVTQSDTEELRDSGEAGALKKDVTTEIAFNSQNLAKECPRKQPVVARAARQNQKTSPALALFSPPEKNVAGKVTNSASAEGTSRETRPSLPIEKPPAVSVAINPAILPKMPQGAPDSNNKKRKRGPYTKKTKSKLVTTPSSVPLASFMPLFPKNYEKFIREISSDIRVENIIDKFNERMDPVRDRILWSAVKEDNEHIQEEREARQLFYNEQIETMNKRLEMYSKLEEAIDLITVENARNHQSKYARSLFKTHIREVTMDLVHIGLSNYQMLEDNMDTILGIND